VKVVAVMVPAESVTEVERVAAVLSAARGAAGAIVRVVNPPGADPKAFAALGVSGGQVMTPPGESAGDCARAVFQDLFRRGAKRVLLVGSDGPSLTGAILADAFTALEDAPAHVVLGPAGDGSYYLLGLAAPQVPDLFTGVRLGTKYALMDTLRRCEFEERRVTFLPLLEDDAAAGIRTQEAGSRTQEAGSR